jgi:hypothetical protein
MAGNRRFPHGLSSYNVLMSIAAPHDELSILRRVIDPEKGNLSKAAAEAIMRLDLDPRDRIRMQELLDKNRDGALTTDEDEELENYCRVGRFLDLMRSKARHSLQTTDA